ncbi:ATP-dependent RNA helicase DDX54 isoform X2 [Prorops nasuta]
MGKFTELKAAVILGGDSMDNQFSIMHGNPDIIVATPGRLLHICVEMDLKLNNVEYVVFDEADRLFEMGFGEQIHEIANRLPETRKTLLFSATLPKILVEFAKAGLTDPVLVRLDVESKLPEELTLSFITCRAEEKLAVLLCLLKNIIKSDASTVVFAATMHHVEYIHQILDKAGISNTFIYSNLDASARKINTAKFQNGKARVLVVTDVAARGIDIPHLDYVINFHFPAKCKLFVHRVGRCARAGRTGTAFNIVSADEYPYLLDLHLFLGRPIQIVPPSGGSNANGEIGKLPLSMVEEELVELINWHNGSTDLVNMEQVCNNAYQQYIRSRPGASSESVKRIKELQINEAGVISGYSNIQSDVTDLLARMKNYRPQGTIFEIGVNASSADYQVMKEKRSFHKENILNFKRKREELCNKLKSNANESSSVKSTLPSSTTDEINETFSQVVMPKKRKIEDLYKKSKKKRQIKDDEFYIPYCAPDKHTEDGLAVNTFATEAEKAQMDLTADSEDSRRLQTQLKKWDRKKKKMVTINNDPKAGKIRTESGVWIPATYKSNRYAQWKEKSKIDAVNDDDSDEEPQHLQKLRTEPHTHWARHNKKLKEKVKAKSEIKRPEQILKARMELEKRRNRNARGKKKGQKKGGRRR